MQLAKVYQHYKIDPKQLSDILAKHNIKVQLKYVKTAPDNWLTILNYELGRTQAKGVAPLEELVAFVQDESKSSISKRSINLELLSDSRILADATPTATVAEALPTSLPRQRPTTTTQNRGNKPKRALPKQPADDELRLGQIIDVVEEKGFGFLQKAGTREEIFWHFSVLGTLPKVNDWVLFAEGPSQRKPGTQQVVWACLLTQNLPLAHQAQRHFEEGTLLSLLSILPEEARAATAQELLGRTEAINDTATWNAAAQKLAKITQFVPAFSAEAVQTILGLSTPFYAWQLWLYRYSPLNAHPTVVTPMAHLLAATESITGWWRNTQHTLPALCLAYLSQHSHDALSAELAKIKSYLADLYPTVYDELVVLWLQQAGSANDPGTIRQRFDISRTVIGDSAQHFEQELFEALPATTHLELWLEDEQYYAFPRQVALEQFSSLPLTAQDKVAANLTDEELVGVSQWLTLASDSQLLERVRAGRDEQLLSAFCALGIDLESDREVINEIAWGRPGSWYVGQGDTAVEEIMQQLRSRVSDGESHLLVGHNIVHFDAPVLAGHDVELPAACLWDTLAVEMALSLDWRVLALRTAHQAQADAQIALKLFLTQVKRVILLPAAEWEDLAPLFGPAVIATLTRLRTQPLEPWVTIIDLRDEAAGYLRPQPQPSSRQLLVQQQLANSTAALTLVLTPTELWGELRAEPGVRFWASEFTPALYRELLAQPLLDQLVDYPAERVIAERFFHYCQQAHIPPVAANMIPAFRLRLQQIVDFGKCHPLPVTPSWQAGSRVCLSAEQLLVQLAYLQGQPDVEVLVLEPDLITLGRKLLLRELTTADVLKSPATRPAWIKFSGGQSFVALRPDQAAELGAVVPAGYSNLWLEKHLYGQFRIWGSFDWELLLTSLTAAQVHVISGTERSFPRQQVTWLGLAQLPLQRRLGITPFNPETIYRSRYWLLQAILVKEILQRNSSAPLILLLQRAEEVEPVEAYFRGQGFYIPQRKVGLGRRLELLHQQGSGRRLLIVPISQATTILEANYLGPIQLILESFNLLENYFLARGSRLFDRARLQARDVEGSETVSSTKKSSPEGSSVEDVLERDLFFLLKLQQPLVQQLRSLLLDNHEKNHLWLLDPRLGDFPALEQSWQMHKYFTDAPWANEEEYLAAAQTIDQVLLSVRPEQDFSLDLEKAKELLSNVFLDGHPWYNIQEPYLNKILPAQTDLLVSLPTGGGKSLLFQAPALYRSAFTNRLTIVITPLKALMEDQVNALWKLGFYSSVEYINQDKRDELPQIYRRLAGGEISLLFITPERFRSGAFNKAFLQRFNNDQGLEYAVYDEAHCISQWGHEFRPDYLYSGKAVQRFREGCPRRFPVLLFSATVSEKIYQEFTELFV